MRSSSKNMCSVRQRPIPSAPKRSAVSASPGVSALARTRSRRTPSAQPISVAKSSESAGSMVGTAPWSSSPLAPSTVTTSPAAISASPARHSRAASSMRRVPAPVTQGRPMPRATTAAWLVMPPRLVTMPRAACMPWMSSGLVSVRSRITASPRAARSSASSASKTTLPEAAPGEAGSPRASTWRSAAGSRVGCRSCSSASGSTLPSASASLTSPSRAMSTAIFSAALAVRLPARVCSSQRVPRCTVNSMSCMSR